jgi:hypothetical protein
MDDSKLGMAASGMEAHVQSGRIRTCVIPAKAGIQYTLPYRLKWNGAWIWISAPPSRCGVLDPRFREDDDRT